MRIAAIVAVVALSVTPDLHAQTTATSLASLADRMKAGQTVVVTLESGEVIKGELATVSDASLILKKPMRTLSATDVQRVAESRRFARPGAFIGGAAGFVLGAAAWLDPQQTIIDLVPADFPVRRPDLKSESNVDGLP